MTANATIASRPDIAKEIEPAMAAWHEYQKEVASVREGMERGGTESELTELLRRAKALLDAMEGNSTGSQAIPEEIPGAKEKAGIVWDFLCEFSVPVPQNSSEELCSLVEQLCKAPLSKHLEDSLKSELQRFQDSVRRDSERAGDLQKLVGETQATRSAFHSFLSMLEELNPPLTAEEEGCQHEL